MSLYTLGTCTICGKEITMEEAIGEGYMKNKLNGNMQHMRCAKKKEKPEEKSTK